MSIPKDGSLEIAQAVEGSEDTQNDVTENTVETDLVTEDSTKEEQPPKENTQKEEDGELAKAKSEYSNLARIQYETLRTDVSKDPDKILEISKHDKKLANKIVKSLWGDKGFHTVDDLVEAAEKEKKYSKVEDTSVKEAMQKTDKLEKEIRTMKQQKAMEHEEKVLNSLYKKYPALHPDKDTDNINWNKFRAEFDDLNPALSLEKRTEKASKLAFGDEIAETESRNLQNELGNLPSSGGKVTTGSPLKLTARQIEIAKRSGNDPESVYK